MKDAASATRGFSTTCRQGHGGLRSGLGFRASGTPNNRLHTDAALRASANVRFEFCVVSVSSWFQADARAARVKRTLGAIFECIKI